MKSDLPRPTVVEMRVETGILVRVRQGASQVVSRKDRLEMFQGFLSYTVLSLGG